MRPRARTAGQSLTEFAIVVPVLLLILFGIIQVGITYGGYNGLINSVRESARFGSVCTGSTCGSTTASHLTSGINSAVFGVKSGSAVGVVTYGTYQDSAGLWNTQITVTGCMRGIVFIPIVGNILGWSDPSGVYLKSTEKFRVEGQPTTAAPTPPSGGADPSGGTCP